MNRRTRPTLLHVAFIILILFLLPLSAGGCLDVPDPAPAPVAEAQPLTFDPIGQGQHATLDTTETVIRDVETWTRYREALRPVQPFKEVDFETEMVLLVAVPVPTGGYSVRVGWVEQQGEQVVAGYTLAVPGDDCMTTMGRAVVFQAVRMAQTDAPVQFQREVSAYACEL